mgnify:CR=1 FL=1
MLVIEIVHNLSVLIVVSLISGTIARRFDEQSLKNGILQGTLYGATTVLVMLFPLVFQPGLVFDGRSVMLSLAGFFFGPLTACIAAAMAILCRILQGGVGTIMEVSVIIASASLGTLGYWLHRRGRFPYSPLRFALLGLVVHIAMVLLAFTLPEALAWNVVNRIGLAIVIAYPLATVVIGMVIEEQKRRHKATLDLKQRLDYETGLVSCARFLQSNQPDNEAIPAALTIILKAIDVDRAYLFENFHDPLDGLCSRQVFEVCSPATTPQAGNPALQHVPWEPVFTPWRKQLEGNEVVQSTSDDFPSSVRGFFESMQIKAVLIIPVFTSNHFFGFIGFDCTREKRSWEAQDIALLRTAADLLANRLARHQNEIQLRQEQKLSSIGTLASGVAHEINNPLTGVINFAQLIHDRLPGDHAEQREYANQIIVESMRISRIVSSLLVFSRQEKQVARTEQVTAVLESIMMLAGRLLEKSFIEISTNIQDNLPPVICIAPQLQQVILNLLTNARDALNQRFPDYDPRKTIRISAAVVQTEKGPCVRIGVHDNGGGIPESIAQRVFDPFFTTKTSDYGTGLGLAISYGIIQEHNGRLWFESRPGEGTDFYIDLPAGQKPAPSACG